MGSAGGAVSGVVGPCGRLGRASWDTTRWSATPETRGGSPLVGPPGRGKGFRGESPASASFIRYK